MKHWNIEIPENLENLRRYEADKPWTADYQAGFLNNHNGAGFNPLTVRTAIWRFGLISNRGIDRTIVLNFPYAS